MPVEITKPENVIRNIEPPADVPVVSMPVFLEGYFKKYADRKLLLDPMSGRSLTGAELSDQTHRLATVLLKRIPDMNRKDVAIFFAPNSLQYLVTQLAVDNLGLVIAPIATSWDAPSLNAMRQTCGGTIVFCSVATAGVVQEMIDLAKKETNNQQFKLIVVLDGKWPGFLALEDLTAEAATAERLDRVPYLPIDPKKDLYIVAHTSGTTGIPKGVGHTHYRYIWNQAQLAKGKCNILVGPVGIDNPILMLMPLGHSSGQYATLQAIMQGRTAVVFGRPDPMSIFRAVQDHRIAYIPMNPLFAELMANGPVGEKFDLSSIQSIGLVVVHYPQEILTKMINRYNLTILSGYAASEMGIVASSGYDPNWVYEADNNGPPVAGVEMKMMPLEVVEKIPDGETVPPEIESTPGVGPGDLGEVWVRSNSLVTEYVNRPDATQLAFTPNSGWYRTGDIGRYNQHGHIFIVDRLKQIICVGPPGTPGEVKILPTVWEGVLCEYPAIMEAIIVPRKSVSGQGHVPRVYALLRPGYAPAPGSETWKFESSPGGPARPQLPTTGPPGAVKLTSGTDIIDHLVKEGKLSDLERELLTEGGVVFVDDFPRISFGKPNKRHFSEQ